MRQRDDISSMQNRQQSNSACLARRRFSQALMLGLLHGVARPAVAEQPRPLQMGLLPYLSSERLFRNYLPVKQYLEAQLGRSVIMITAPDFKTYLQRAAQGDYDIYHTAPHFALLAEKAHGYRRLARFNRELSANLVVRTDSRIQQISDLRGATVISPDPLAITSMLGEKLLEDNGLHASRDYTLLRSSSHNNALWTVYRGRADAAFTSQAVFEHLSPSMRRALRVLSHTREVPHMMLMANTRLSESEYAQIKKTLLAFTENGPGQGFFASTGYRDIGPITDPDMARLQHFLPRLTTRLND